MNLSSLRLLAFGPFTDVAIEFDAADKGLNIIFGPNEAGKSSSLRAIRYLLFGFPQRLTDDFLHPYDKLRLGGQIKANGATVDFVRRKLAKNPLRDGDDQNVIPESTVAQLMPGLDAKRFEKMFGIDHAELRHGGAEIVAGRGDVGEILFSASTGIADLHSIAQKLKAECDERFNPNANAKAQRMNKALIELSSARQKLKDLTLPSSQWVQLDRSLKDTKAKKGELEAELASSIVARAKYQRLKDSLEPIARRKELLTKLEPLKNVARLSPQFSKQWRDSVALRSSLLGQLTQDNTQLELLDKELSDRPDVGEWIARAHEIDALQLALGKHNKAVADRADLVRDQKQLDSEIAEILRQLGRPTDLSATEVEKLRVIDSQAARIQDLSQQYQKISAQCESAQNQLVSVEQNLARIARQVEDVTAPSDPEPLRRILSQAGKHRSLEQQLQSETAELKRLDTEIEREFRSLQFVTTNRNELSQIVLPSLVAIQQFETDFAAVEATVRESKSTIKNFREQVIQVDKDIDLLKTKGDIPTSEEVDRARENRAAGWNLIVRAWLKNDGENAAATKFIRQNGAADLADAYTKSVSNADELADRRWREAERVAQLNGLTARRMEITRRLELAESSLSAEEGDRTALTANWHSLWASITKHVGTPREMQGWHKQFYALVEKFDQATVRREKISGIEKSIGEHVTTLFTNAQSFFAGVADEPNLPRDSLVALLDRCEELCETAGKSFAKWRDLQREQTRLDQELMAAKSQQEAAHKRLADWNVQWSEAIEFLGLTRTARPVEANAVVTKTNELFKKRDFSSSIAKRIIGIDRDRNEFFGSALALAKRIAPELASLQGDRAAAEMSSQLVKARDIRKETELLADQRRMVSKRCKENELKLADLNVQIELLCREARCKSAEEFLAIEELDGERNRLETELAKVEEKIRYIGKGHSVEELEREAELLNFDEAELQIRKLNERIEATQEEVDRITQEVGGLQQQLRMMDGRADAAEARADVEEQLALIGQTAREYAQLRLGYVALQNTIERFRQQNQGPILSRAAEIFQKLTVGSFSGLEVEQTDNGPVLVGKRDGKSSIVNVEGMSDGTTDQLYLSVRLASLHHYLDSNPPVPFIVDDILIHFDDARAGAALEALAELSKRTQVFFFTHHEHLLLLAEKRLKTSQFAVHRLPSR